MPAAKGTPEHEAWRLKIQATMRKRLADPETRARHVERMNVAVRTGEGNQARLGGLRRMAQDPVFQQRRIAAMNMPEAKAKHAASQKRRWVDPASKSAHRVAALAAMARPEVVERRRRGVEQWRSIPDNVERRTAAAHSPTANAKRNASLKRAWADPVRRAERIAGQQPHIAKMLAGKLKPGVEQRRLEGLAAAFRRDPSDIEVIVYRLLDTFGIAFEAQRVIGRYIVDVFIPDRNLILECDGSWWHANSKPDRLRDAWLTAQGFTVVRLQEMHIRRDAAGLLASALEGAIG